jgi:hypothetical protein
MEWWERSESMLTGDYETLVGEMKVVSLCSSCKLISKGLQGGPKEFGR